MMQDILTPIVPFIEVERAIVHRIRFNMPGITSLTTWLISRTESHPLSACGEGAGG